MRSVLRWGVHLSCYVSTIFATFFYSLAIGLYYAYCYSRKSQIEPGDIPMVLIMVFLLILEFSIHYLSYKLDCFSSRWIGFVICEFCNKVVAFVLCTVFQVFMVIDTHRLGLLPIVLTVIFLGAETWLGARIKKWCNNQSKPLASL